MSYDLAVLGGTVVTGRSREVTNLYIREGRVAGSTPEVHRARREVDASGLLVLPGVIDGHVHFQDPGDTDREDFTAGSSAAAAGGVTTVIEHTHSHPVRSIEFLREKMAHLKTRSLVDYGLGAHVWPEDVDRVASLWRAGLQFFKVFTCSTHGIPAVLPGSMLRLLEACAACDGLCLVHCEDEFITAENEQRLKKEGRMDYGILPEWRSRAAEEVASSTVALLARMTGARTVIAHVSHPLVLELIERDRRAGGRLWVESCPQYLYITEEEILKYGPYRKFTPPARGAGEVEDLWKAVSLGAVTHVSSDHAPSTRAQKAEGEGNMWKGHFGLPGVQTTLTMLLSGVAAGRLTVERVVQLLCEAPARLYRLWPRKGNLEPGADADLVLVDLERRWRLENRNMLSRSGWTPFEGMEVRGYPVATFLRGKLVAQGGEPAAEPGTGRFLAGPGATAETLPQV